MRSVIFACIALLAASPALAANTADPLAAQISVADIDLFFGIYDQAGGKPDAAALQAYIDKGSDGVQGFLPDRIVSADNLAQVIAASPDIYEGARVCARQLGDVRARVRAGFLALSALYPDAAFPQTYILIGANNSGGTANAGALMIGLEVMCRSDAPDTAPLDVRLTHIIVHELIHSQQKGFTGETLLPLALTEGIAEFVTELATGRISNAHLHNWTAGHEGEIAQRFAAAMDGADYKSWLYNGVGTPEAPGDLGYWVGYRIARAFYDRAPDKRQAVTDMLLATDAKAFLAASGWTPDQP